LSGLLEVLIMQLNSETAIRNGERILAENGNNWFEVIRKIRNERVHDSEKLVRTNLKPDEDR